ncbi:MAG: hypothetical protein H7281_16825 [Bacteriovorax sp.]|nr:hypothetical protein [Bacteriovorax sp.]
MSGPRKFGIGESNEFMPQGAVEFINKKFPRPGNVFNTHFLGNYLAWKWDGKIKVFYHGFVTDTNFYVNEYLPFFQYKTFNEYVKKYDIKCIIVDAYSVDVAFIQMVRTNPSWTFVYEDSKSAVFIRN